MVTLESRSVFHLWEQIQDCFANFPENRSHRCCSQCHTMLKSNRVQPQIKMVNVIPETAVARLQILNSCRQRNFNGYTPKFSVYTAGLVWILSVVRVTGKSNMAANNRKYICNSSFSACTQDSHEIPTFSVWKNSFLLLRYRGCSFCTPARPADLT